MSTEKLEKSVTVPAPKYPLQVSNFTFFVCVFFSISLITNLGLALNSWNDAREIEYWSSAYHAELKKSDGLQQKLGRLRYDMKELTSDEAEALQLTDAQSIIEFQEFLACLEQPEGILITPWALGMPYWELKVHNPEPILSTSADGDCWFTPGSACSINRQGAISITRRDDLYIMQPWTPPTATRNYAECPDSAYHLVSSQNEVVLNALLRACLTKIKARDLRLLAVP